MQVIANIVGLLAIGVFNISYQFKKRIQILLCSTFSRLLFVVQYILLGSWQGVAMDLVATVVSLVAGKRDHRLMKKYMVFVIILANAIVVSTGLLLYENIFSIFSILGVVFETSAFWLKNEKQIRIFSLLGAPCWMAFNLGCGSYAGAAGNVITLISIGVALVRYDLRKPKKTEAV
jgi:hypothetical protein